MYNPGNFYDFFNTNFFYISYTDECENLDSDSENVHNDLGKIKGILDNLINNKINGVNLKEQNCDSFNKWINKKKSEYICNRDNDENHIKEIFPIQFCMNTKLDDCCDVEYTQNYSKIKKFLYNKYIKVCSIKNNIKNSYSPKNTEDFFLGSKRKRINIHYLSQDFA
ncbi:variable surface protein [Plasmodium gonderi]|uniref:Variable surface protein n=1 Tax=Plasmodium gonderi TaxID=77519 RepID=A0A1Y1JNQ4_PLAGO|nr:variable surface protein [Plasmodium gonderi]GAW84216.1 variable surface protein [Plasmodium gonderi]